ncbi:hypothetical protein Bacsa_3375 [Phocaeicola salanitronis DSM 18170]|uniref:site-specific DNA-methyltransferase (adenine-specific) n=1 Tax=Phocaeicola salanitronis (strain DSM 18170 / JCM 13657 / CCUG 60908 / BL78) TaxID=667015 RepID=F0R5Z4_PHOSB|nr:TaqI-like C-terminal specificity domain-containing protein [Phocaeicola salanitronis]ADY37900.1 hypothetical protein Bacsa_3375 [Phocaeicola salanitronis DSM 18170]
MYFDQPYNRHEFVSFLRHDFLPNLDFVQEETPVAFPIQTQYCCDIATKLGTCQSLDLVIYEIRHHSKSDARVGMSKEAFRLLANEFEDKALVIFIPEDNTDNYRLSFIEITLHQDEDSSRVKKTYSNPRRYSYYLGKGIAWYTPNKYLNEAGRVTSIEDLRNRFSVEVLTKSFYQELSDWYAWVVKIIRFPNKLNDPTDDDKFNAESTIRLVTRLIFVWFLKQKSLIPNEFFDRDYIKDNLLEDFNPEYNPSLFYNAGESKYYKAILQNLFFAMLNSPITKEGETELSERHFRKNRGDYDNNKLMRYESLFANPQLFVDLANRTVPFLNGGLFDCLDDKDADNYIDGFSDRKEVQESLFVPDYIFFAKEVIVDLSHWYEDKKKKKVKVSGILNILKRYNFTIEENTPFDQEVSLDPELLGKVFENLLASYNPETQTTARKQTGSFYTPREIVQYMVDESLVAHLKRTVGEELESQFRQLMQYTDDEVNLTDEQRKRIMQSLYNCKILDPACGSGAFPMGMLQQMVHILSRIDPGNTQWREMMLDMAANKTSEVDRTGSSEYLEIKADIIRSFDENINRPDYARKLYLIENCIYGVDIQSIAIQISKLRFFISLIVDQKTNNNPADNFGIRPLPNLEAKFVAANTLIPLTKHEGELGRTPAVIAIEDNLKEANHKIFRAKSVKTKRRWKDRLKELRKDLATQLVNDGFLSADSANQLASWDMFDQNASASFFDAEWMFGVKDGFDIVIGNPPYGAKFSKNEKQLLKSIYQHQNYQPESYLFFLEKGIELTKTAGILSFIIPNTWLINLKCVKIRQYIFNFKTILSISHYHKSVFDAIVDTEVVIIKNMRTIDNTVYINNHTVKETSVLSQNQRRWAKENGNPVNIFISEQDEQIIDKIMNESICLSEIANVYAGLVPYEEGKGNPPQTREMMKAKIYNSTYKIDDSYRKAIRGTDINRYVNLWNGKRWLKYGNNLAAPRKSNIFDNDKIIVRQTGDSIIATYDAEKFVCFKNTHVINGKQGTNLYYVLGLLNSKLINYYFRYLNPETGETLAEVKKEIVEKLRIKQSSYELELVDIVKEILTIKMVNVDADTSTLENNIDLMVYHLYGLTYDEVLIVDPQTPITQDEYEK